MQLIAHSLVRLAFIGVSLTSTAGCLSRSASRTLQDEGGNPASTDASPSEGVFPAQPEVAGLSTGKVFVDHVGYETLAPKRALVLLPPKTQANEFELVDAATGSVQFRGPLGDGQAVREWSPAIYHMADFSGYEGQGRFFVRVLLGNAASLSSTPFDIGSAIHFRRTFDLSLTYFRRSRATSEPAASWDRTLRIVGKDGMAPVDLQGGWYDAAGDISKYLSHLSFANYLNPQQTPLTVWALAAVAERQTRLPQTTPDQLTRIVDEARFGADFLVKMFSPEGYFYISVFDQWSGTREKRFIAVPVDGSVGTQSSQVEAAYREGGGMAIAALARTSRLLSGTDPQAFARYVDIARRGFAHLEADNRRYCDDALENIIDDYTALLAATELYLATKDDSYLSAARKRASNLNQRLSDSGYFFSDAENVPVERRSRPFWHASDAGLPVVALARYLEAETETALIDAARTTIRKHLDYQLQVSRQVSNPFDYARQHFRYQGNIRSGFFIPQENETTYWWQGENARLGSLTTALILGGEKVHGPVRQGGFPRELLGLAVDQIAWILGRNPYDVSFMEGVGHDNAPAYTPRKPGHGHLPGGIVNGITGRVGGKTFDQAGREYRSGDGTGLSWNPPEANPPQAAEWENWRWVEQWLPHTTWYMLAITALAEQEQ